MIIQTKNDFPQFDCYEKIGSIYLMYRNGRIAGLWSEKTFKKHGPGKQP